MSFQPATPQSPSQLSPNTSDLMNSSMSSSATCATTNTLPTPAHSVNGSSMATEMTSMGSDSPQNKRKRPIDDMGDRDRKKAHTEGHRLGIEDLHLDVGMKYLVCKTQRPVQKPDISLDLFEMYGLTDIAAEVARVLPNGEKNAIRKTYKGHIKKLEVAGVWDSVKSVDMKAPDHLFTMCQIPDHDWDVHFVHGKDFGDGFSAETKAKLHRATAMGKGVLPKSMWDSSVLGDMAPGKGGRQSARPTAPNTPVVTGTGVPRAKPLTPAAQDANRPKRNIKKRGYGESSYEGYEGYDDGAETGYSTGEGESHKKIKKSHLGSANTKPFAASQQQAVSSSAM